MIVVGDTGPLNYLVLIGHAEILPAIFTRVLIPKAVAKELSSSQASRLVRQWIETPPSWLDIRPDPADDGTLSTLDYGERAAIASAITLGAPRILMDDMDGRLEAERRRLQVTGTLGLLVEAHHRGLLDFEDALSKLAATSFYLSPALIARVRQLL